ncbi:CU044_5270 family protein [Virgisporangium aurantiacum]|nr:CU044_5270 family protein [Virgisporangium aurantiacum]
MHTLQAMRSEVPLPPDDVTRAAEARLMTAIRREPPRHRQGVRVGRFAWAAGLAAGLAAVVAVGVLATQNGPIPPKNKTPQQETPLKLTSATQVLDLAATATTDQPDLNPRPDQVIAIRSNHMYVADGPDGRYLYRTDRTLWSPADGVRDGAVESTYLDPKAIPGQPIPPSARSQVGRKEASLIKRCPGTPDWARTDFAHVSKLPTTPEGMLAELRRVPANKNPLDQRTFQAAADLVREAYLPPAQRAALYRALALIPGLELIENAQDAAGRTGVAVGYRDTARGLREELVFDPATFQYLGEREFVIDAAKAQAPVGTQTASTALLSAEVVDTVPAVPVGPKGQETCG